MDARTLPARPPWFHRGLAVAWIALLWLPLVQMAFRPVPESPATVENRSKAAIPHLRGRDLKALKVFTEAFEKYFGDSFGFRDGLIRAHNQLHVRGLRTSPLATIVIGRNDWLFYNNAADGRNLTDYCGLAPLSGKELEAIERNLIATRDELRRRGIAFTVLVAPNKHTIYPEHLPERIRALAGTTRLDQLAARLGRHPDIPFVDVRQTLLAAKGEQPLYFRTDTHWNRFGAHLAARRLLADLARAGVPVAPPRDEDLVLKPWDRPHSDLTNMLGLPVTGHDQDFHLLDRAAKKSTITTLPPRKGQLPGRETRTCTTGETGLRFLLFHDSFGMALTPALCNEFSDGVAIFETRVLERSLEPERPDVVIFEVVERYLDVLAKPKFFARRD